MDDNNAVRKIVKDELRRYAIRNQYGVSKIPAHAHTGTDSLPILQKNIINNNKYGLEIISSDDATPGGETFTISNLPNISQIFFNGFAANNAADLTLPGTKKATIVGGVQFGKCYGTPSTSGQVNDIQFANVVNSFLQSTSSMYIDTTDITKTTVTGSGRYFALAEVNNAGTPTVLATAKIVSYDNSTLTITTTFAAGWELTGWLVMV